MRVQEVHSTGGDVKGPRFSSFDLLFGTGSS